MLSNEGKKRLRVCLAGAPTLEHVTQETVVEHDSARDIADRVPLGVLSLAAVLERDGVQCAVVDLNRAFLENTRTATPREDFAAFATRYLLGFDFDLLGLGTMCSSYPVTLQIAARVKERRPDSLIVLGGPQASVTDMATMQTFAHVDFVVRGEADESLLDLIRALENGRDFASIAGITFRNQGKVVRTPSPSRFIDLDELPLPAFHLQLDIEGLDILPLELGRGCPFSCTFCSTNDFFRRRFRLKRPETVIDQMRTLNHRYGTTRFILVHDMFTVDRKRVVDFCRAMIASGTGFEWSCSARTDSVDDDLLGLMASAGCRGLFFGVETGSLRMQKVIEKELDLTEAFAMVSAADHHGIDTTVSTIIGFPEEEASDVEATMNFLMASIRFDHVEPQVGLLAPLAGTPLYLQYRDALEFDPIMADFSYSSWYEDDHQFTMIRSHQEIFCNFFALPTRVPRKYLFELKLFFHAAFHQCRWLFVAVHQELGGVCRVFDLWLRHSREKEHLVNYYISPKFKSDFVGFCRALGETEKFQAPATHILATAQAILDSAPSPRRSSEPPTARKGKVFNPILVSGIEICDLPGNVEEAITGLKLGTQPGPMVATPHLVRRREEVSELVPLTDSMAQALRLCDGSRSASEIMAMVSGFSLSESLVTDFFGQLGQENIVTFEGHRL
jgi:radical SAM superfamily enzyme YgiQ (UPF0313 family)